MRACTHQGHHHPARGTRGREGRWGAMLFVALVLVSISGVGTFGATLPPPADLVCRLTQLTHSTGGISEHPSINAAGRRIAFHSSADLTGGNPDGNQEIFLVDTTTGNFTQLTSTGGHFNLEPSINALGTRIAFVSDADLTGDNPDGLAEIFLVDTTTGRLTQLTHSTSGAGSGNPSINALGTRIAFGSDADLTGDNPDGLAEIFLVDTTTGSLTQLTHGGGGAPSINALGTRIAFATTADLTGDNPDGTQEIFLADTTIGRLTQLTHSTLGTGFPSINALGTRIAFGSNSNLTGDNPDGNSEIFLVDTRTGRFTQLTSSTGSSHLPSINAVGTRVAFVSNADLTGGNADRNFELFLVDTTTGSLTQLTTGGVIFTIPSINATGTRIAFESTADLTGDNPDGNREIFLATCVGTVHDPGTMTGEETGEQEQ